MFGDKAEELLVILEAGGNVSVPTSALKSLRGNRHQQEVAREAAISQPYLSEMENGTKPLTRSVAEKLAPVLGCEAGELETAEHISRLQRLALKGSLDPGPLFQTIEELAFSMPEGDLTETLIDALLGVLAKALETYEANEGVGVGMRSC